jgi:precorrin-6B methylase 2
MVGDDQVSTINSQIDRAAALHREEARVQGIKLEQARLQTRDADIAQAEAKKAQEGKDALDQLMANQQKTLDNLKQKYREEIEAYNNKVDAYNSKQRGGRNPVASSIR